jgi:hypothetical protein
MAEISITYLKCRLVHACSQWLLCRYLTNFICNISIQWIIGVACWLVAFGMLAITASRSLTNVIYNAIIRHKITQIFSKRQSRDFFLSAYYFYTRNLSSTHCCWWWIDRVLSHCVIIQTISSNIGVRKKEHQNVNNWDLSVYQSYNCQTV